MNTNMTGLCVLVLMTKVASALKGLKDYKTDYFVLSLNWLLYYIIKLVISLYNKTGYFQSPG